MHRDTVTELNRRLLQHALRNSQDTAAETGSVPAEVFTDPGQLERERRRIFLDSPQPVAFAAELPAPGSYLAVDIVGIPVLLTRDDRGTIHAFINSCSHRGAPIAGGAGTANNLTCPFHGWTFALDGALRGRPGAEYFDGPARDLQPLPVSDRHGVVVVGLAPEIPQSQVDTALEEIGEELAGFGIEAATPLARRDYRVAANWKLVNDLSLESYHFASLHRDSVATLLTGNAVVDTYKRSSRWAFPLKTITRLAELDEEEWPDGVEGSVTYTTFPGVMLIVNALGAQLIRAEPGRAPGESSVTYSGIAWRSASREDAMAAYEFGGEVFESEDLPIAEACQRGLQASGRPQVLGRNEPLLQFWHTLWEQACADD